MLSSDKQLVQFVVSAMVHYQITKVVISPGSRNSAFAIAFDAHPKVETLVVHDERCAAFIALGWAQQSAEPVALCCTSGSACLNYYPAIAEAYYRNIPLLALTVDRPAKWINQGDGQTIVQQDVFKNHVHAYLEFDEDNFVPNHDHTNNAGTFFEHLYSDWKGPIHLNVGLNEPLYNLAELSSFSFPIKESTSTKKHSVDFKQIEGRKIMILIGQMDHNSLLEQILGRIASHSNVVVLVENTSNLRHPLFNHCIDRSLNLFDASNSEYHPQVLITLGGAVVSKRIKAFLRQVKLNLHWRIAADFPQMNTYGQLSGCYSMNPIDFFKLLEDAQISLNTHNFQGKWKALDYQAKDQQAQFTTDSNYLTDYDVFESLNHLISATCNLHLANSSVVRYAQLFDPNPSLIYHSNRGTSGIDGSVSTAVGAALASPEQNHLLICGDTSFIYDSNALWTTPFPKNLKIIVIDNQGGGIFQIIDGSSTSPLREKYFEAIHTKSPGKIAQGFGFEVLFCSEKKKLEKTLQSFLADEQIQIMQISTAKDQNAAALKDFFNFIKTH